MSEVYDVVIAGAGPVGLFLACELALACVSVLVLERDPKPDSQWKCEPLGLRGLNTVSVEALYRRGLLDKLFDLGERPSTLQKTSKFQFAGHFAGISLDLNKLDLTRWKYRLPGPSLMPGPTTIEKLEKVLTERAASLGVLIERGCGVNKIIHNDDDGVTLTAGKDQLYRCKWLVACDGGRSMIRRAAGFEFAGSEAKFTGYAIKCDFDQPEKLNRGFNITKNGMYIRGLPGSLYLVDFDNATFDRSKEITIEHLQDVLNRVTSTTDVKITKVHLASSFTDRSKQATSYRKGRIILAGDAAHIHSPLGAQGLNLGLGDAVNLGWKLAATVQKERSADGLLTRFTLIDTYESERHPIAAWVLEWTRAQVSTLQPDLFGNAVQTLMRDLMNTVDGTNLFIDRIWGLSQRYHLDDDANDAHPLVGCSAPDFELEDGPRLGPKLEAGNGLLIDFGDDAVLEDLVKNDDLGSKVTYLKTSAKDQLGLGSILIRPDGIVAWVTDQGMEPDREAAKKVLEKWF